MADLKSKIAAIVARRLPKGYKLVEHKEPYGHGSSQLTKRQKVIRCPPLVDRWALAVFLHEVAHVVLGHLEKTDKTPKWEAEYDAEKWAFTIMQAEGIPVSDEIKANARAYVRECIEEAQLKDPHIDVDEEILRFAFPDTWKEAA
jgi:hypothetical protein